MTKLLNIPVGTFFLSEDVLYLVNSSWTAVVVREHISRPRLTLGAVISMRPDMDVEKVSVIIQVKEM